MLSPEEDNRAASETEVKVTLSATEAGESIRKHFSNVLHRAGQRAALNVQGSF
jgi:hypothetical protein